MRTLSWCATAALLFSSAAVAQTATPEAVAATAEVRVINVDVAALDSTGHPVRDLTRDDFEVFEDGKLKPLTNFSIIDNTAKTAEVPLDGGLQLRRRLILLVDNNYIEKRDRNLALDKLDHFIDETFDGTYDWSVAVIGQHLEVLQPFTTDKELIHKAVARIRRMAVSSMRMDMEDRSALDTPMQQRSQRDESAAIGFGGRERTNRNARSLAATTQAIVEAAHAFATTEGRKTAVLVTGAMDMATDFGAHGGSDRELKDLKTLVGRLIDRVVREANLAEMSIHVLNTATLRTTALQHDAANASSGLGRGATGRSSAGFGAATDTADTSTPLRLAEGTGGLYLSRDVRQSLDTVNAASSHFYLLGYAPGHPNDRQYHRISVKVKRPGVRITHRQGYLDLSEDERLEQFLRVRASLLHPAREVPVNVTVRSGTSGEGANPVVTVQAAMPFDRVTFLQREGSYSGRVHVYLSVFDATGKNVGFHHRTQDLVFSSAQHEQAARDAFRYQMAVRLARGEYTVAVTLRDDLSRDIGTAIEKLKL